MYVKQETITFDMYGKDGVDICNKVRQRYSNIYTITVVPTGEEGLFGVVVELFDPKALVADTKNRTTYGYRKHTHSTKVD